MPLDLRGPKHGFSVDMLLDLLKAGLATTKRERMVAGGRQTDVARVRIREAGRQALARCPSDPDAEAVVLDLVQPLAAEVAPQLKREWSRGQNSAGSP